MRRWARFLLACLALPFVLFVGTGEASAASLTSTNSTICNQTVSSISGVSAVRLSGGDCLIQFTTASTPNSWTVPSGISSIQFLVVGGGGGGGIDAGSGGGGGGGYYESDSVVSPGSSISIYVGAGGAYGNYGVTTPTNGESSTLSISGVLFAGLGGAAATNGISTNPQPAVAQGGGSIGSGGTAFTGANGGAGVGWVTGVYGPGSNGNAGFQSSITDTSTYYGGSGAGGGNTATLTTVALRTGGSGGGGNATAVTSGTYTSPTAGTANTGGGGGAGMSNASPQSNKSSAGGGSGIVIIRYTPITLINTVLNLGGTFAYRTATSVTTYTSIAGVVSFKSNGKFIPGCRNRASNAGNSFTATCTFKPAVHGSIVITSIFTPTDSAYQSATATGVKSGIGTRSSSR